MKTFILVPITDVPMNDANRAINELVPFYRDHQVIATIMTASAGPFIGKIEEITATEITIRWSEDDDDPMIIARCDIATFSSDFARVGRRLEHAA
jgi:hypothetical protein